MAAAKRNYKWTNAYNAKTYDRVALDLPKGERDLLKAHVEKYGKGVTASVNGYIKQAIQQAMERDLSPPPQGL